MNSQNSTAYQDNLIRMIETGFKEAAGAYHYSSGHHCYINREDAFYAYSNDSAFRKLIDSGFFRYVDGYYVIDDGVYIDCDDSGNYSLTDFASIFMTTGSLQESSMISVSAEQMRRLVTVYRHFYMPAVLVAWIMY